MLERVGPSQDLGRTQMLAQPGGGGLGSPAGRRGSDGWGMRDDLSDDITKTSERDKKMRMEEGGVR